VSVPLDSPWAFVAVGRPLRGEYTYKVPEELRGKLQPGQRVRVPFGRQSILGFFLAPAGEPNPDVVKRLKSIERPLEDTAALTPELVELLRFAAAHYRYPLGEAMRGAMPPGLSKNDDGKEAKADLTWWAVAAPDADLAKLVRAPAQHAALSYLLAVGGRALVEELAHAIPGAKATLKVLAQKGLVVLDSQEVVHGVRAGLEQGRPEKLTPEQHIAVEGLIAALDVGGFQTFLLHGVTGSGKTEVYLRLVERALELGKGALILVPEIALTPQRVGRFKSRFGPQIAVLHSALKDRERLRHWQLLRNGTVKIAVGVRSAIWAPVANLGVVVVDEEHDPSFKQDEKLKYQARDLAVVRAQKAGALVVLGSATPSLETLENVRKGRYQTLTLDRRVDDRPMPTIALVDLRVARPRQHDEEPPVLSAALKEAIGETLAKGQQVILFLNRRGHSTFVLCEVCGESLKCQDCDVCLTHHLSSRRLVCHYCNRQQFLPNNCPQCSGPLLQLGVGTERVEAEVASSFPGARVARLDRDAASNNERLTELLASFARREIDVLVGTQMVAKGHDFPGVTLVCVVLADSSLALPDFRAAERTFHLLTQVAGRAGRGKDPGRVLVQSYHPESEAVARMLHSDFSGFAQNELRRRKVLGWPPYTRMAMVRIEGEDAGVTATTAKRLGQAMAQRLPPASAGVRLLGPAPAPLSKIKGKTRWQIVLKGPTHASLNGPLDAAEALLAELPQSVRVVLDVDPGAML
jgi:primosomal protein N' (replication factor Y)